MSLYREKHHRAGLEYSCTTNSTGNAVVFGCEPHEVAHPTSELRVS